jgi:hypothetical protein
VDSKEIRSKNMATIKGNTKPEMIVRKTVRTLAFSGLNDSHIKESWCSTSAENIFSRYSLFVLIRQGTTAYVAKH